MLKFANAQKTAATFDGLFLTLSDPEDWSSIGDAPTREAVIAWLDAGNVAEPFPAKTNAQLMAEELVALAAVYKITTTQLQLNWLTAMVNDGSTEVAKKEAVVADIAAAKTQYLTDRVAIQNKYA